MVALMEKHKVIFLCVMKIIEAVFIHKNGKIKTAFWFVRENYFLCTND